MVTFMLGARINPTPVGARGAVHATGALTRAFFCGGTEMIRTTTRRGAGGVDDSSTSLIMYVGGMILSGLSGMTIITN